jgi:excisionase family DNA binding protein
MLSGMGQTETVADTRPLLTPREAAELMAVSRKTIYREIDRGELPALKVGHQLRIDPDELRAYLRSGTDLA